MRDKWIDELYDFFEDKGRIDEFPFILAARVEGGSGPELLISVGDKMIDILRAQLVVGCYESELPMPVTIVGFERAYSEEDHLQTKQVLEIGQIIVASDLDQLEQYKQKRFASVAEPPKINAIEAHEIMEEMMLEEREKVSSKC